MDRAGQHRRLRHHRLQDRDLAQWHLQLDQPRRQHQQHHHHLRPLRAGRRHHAPLPRLGHQHQRDGPPLQRRRRHHRHHRARAPTSLSATASGSTTINLSWTAPADNGGSAITGYRIEISPNGTSNWTNRVANTNSTTTTYAHSGLAAGTTRHYRVSAINTTGGRHPLQHRRRHHRHRHQHLAGAASELGCRRWRRRGHPELAGAGEQRWIGDRPLRGPPCGGHLGAGETRPGSPPG